MSSAGAIPDPAAFGRPELLPSEALAPLGPGLAALNASMAEEFLALAAILQQNAMRAREIAASSRRATGAESNAGGNHALEVLERILGESSTVSGMVESSAGHMSEILLHVERARAPLVRLTKMRSLLQTVGVLSRIEGGRITNTRVDLSSLSRDIDQLAEQVQRHLDGIASDSVELAEALRAGMRELGQFEGQERARSAELIRHTRALLEPVAARAEHLKAAAKEIDAQYASVQQAAAQVIMSLQSEDIARQRIEHVQDALRRVGDTLDAGGSMAECAGLLAVQRAQLVGTRKLLLDSLQSIEEGLAALGPRVRELVERTAELAGEGGRQAESFAALVNTGQETVVNVYGQCESSARAVRSIVARVVPSVEEMTRGAVALEEIEGSIQLISLNATIKTAHLGEDGVAMGVVASELHAITRRSHGDTESVLTSLAAIEGALLRVAGSDGAARSLSFEGGDEVRRELGGLIEQVRDAVAAQSAGLGEVRARAEELCAESERGCRIARQAQRLAALYDEQIEIFDRQSELLGYSPELASAGAGASEAELTAMYSMESERELHRQVFGGEEGTLAEANGIEFGEDVELF